VDQLPLSIIASVALLTLFLCLVVGLKYARLSNFARTRLIMTSFFLFIVATLAASFWQYVAQSLPYTIAAVVCGIVVGYTFGVRAEQQKMRVSGMEHYLEHFAHIHLRDFTELNWWSVINFYSVAAGLVLINLVALSTVIFDGNEEAAILTLLFGAFLLGSIMPYVAHLWSIRAPHHTKSTSSER